MPDLLDLCAAAVEAAEGGEHVEAFGEERSTTSVEAHRGKIEGLTFAESRGVGVRVISDGRLGFAHAADQSVDEVREAFGEEVVEHYLNRARVELDAYEATVTDWEKFRGFERL